LHELRAWAILADVMLQLNLSRVVLYFINNSQDTGVRRRGVRRRVVPCLLFMLRRSAILDSNSVVRSSVAVQ
jgi:hypothetical protein